MKLKPSVPSLHSCQFHHVDNFPEFSRVCLGGSSEREQYSLRAKLKAMGKKFRFYEMSVVLNFSRVYRYQRRNG